MHNRNGILGTIVAGSDTVKFPKNKEIDENLRGKNRIVYYVFRPERAAYITAPPGNGNSEFLELEGYTGEWAMEKIESKLIREGRF